MNDQPHPLRGRRHAGPRLSEAAEGRAEVRGLVRRRRASLLLSRVHRLHAEMAALYWVALEFGNTTPAQWPTYALWEDAYGLGKEAEHGARYLDAQISKLARDLRTLGVDPDAPEHAWVPDRSDAARALGRMEWWRWRVEATRLQGVWTLRLVAGEPFG